MVEDYGIPAPYKFTGQIARITVDVKEMKPADKAAEDKAAAEAQLQKAVRNWGRAGREVIGTRRPCEKGDRHGSRGHAGRDGSASDSPGAGDRSEVLRPQAVARRSRWFGDELAERYEDKVRVRLGLGYRPSSRTRLDAIYIRDWNRDSPEVYAVEDTQAIDLRWKLFF